MAFFRPRLRTQQRHFGGRKLCPLSAARRASSSLPKKRLHRRASPCLCDNFSAAPGAEQEAARARTQSSRPRAEKTKGPDAWQNRRAARRDSAAHQLIARRRRPAEEQKTPPLFCPRSRWCKEAAASCSKLFRLLGIHAEGVFLSLPPERIFKSGTALRNKKRIARKRGQIIQRQKTVFRLAL